MKDNRASLYMLSMLLRFAYQLQECLHGPEPGLIGPKSSACTKQSTMAVDASRPCEGASCSGMPPILRPWWRNRRRRLLVEVPRGERYPHRAYRCCFELLHASPQSTGSSASGWRPGPWRRSVPQSFSDSRERGGKMEARRIEVRSALPDLPLLSIHSPAMTFRPPVSACSASLWIKRPHACTTSEKDEQAERPDAHARLGQDPHVERDLWSKLTHTRSTSATDDKPSVHLCVQAQPLRFGGTMAIDKGAKKMFPSSTPM